MIQMKFAKTLILGVCLSIGSSGAVYASASDARLIVTQDQTTELKTTEKSSLETAVSSPSLSTPEEENDILQKQSEIDQYLFVQHREEISQKGFMVTHTGPMDNYVEIGIEPYNDDNAEYLYKLFGRDKVKVVQGQQATTLELGAARDGVEYATDLKASVTVASDENRENVAGRTSLPLMVVYMLGAVTVLGALALALKRLQPIVKK